MTVFAAKKPDQDIQPLAENDGYFSVNEVALMFKMSAWTLRKWIRQGIVPAVGRRNILRVRPCDVMPKVRPSANIQPKKAKKRD